MNDFVVITANDERLIMWFIARELFCDNCKSLHDGIFLILVVRENSLESRQLGYWERGEISRVGEIYSRASSPWGELSRGR